MSREECDEDDPKEFDSAAIYDREKIVPNGALLVIIFYAVATIACIGLRWFVLTRRVID